MVPSRKLFALLKKSKRYVRWPEMMEVDYNQIWQFWDYSMSSKMRKIFCILNAILSTGILFVVVPRFKSYESVYGSYYLLSILGLFVLWFLAMAGMYHNQRWSYLLGVIVLSLQQVVLIIVGVWMFKHAFLFVVMMLIFYIFWNQKQR